MMSVETMDIRIENIDGLFTYGHSLFNNKKSIWTLNCPCPKGKKCQYPNTCQFIHVGSKSVEKCNSKNFFLDEEFIKLYNLFNDEITCNVSNLFNNQLNNEKTTTTKEEENVYFNISQKQQQQQQQQQEEPRYFYKDFIEFTKSNNMFIHTKLDYNMNNKNKLIVQFHDSRLINFYRNIGIKAKNNDNFNYNINQLHHFKCNNNCNSDYNDPLTRLFIKLVNPIFNSLIIPECIYICHICKSKSCIPIYI
jgi:hypothetical protein